MQGPIKKKNSEVYSIHIILVSKSGLINSADKTGRKQKMARLSTQAHSAESLLTHFSSCPNQAYKNQVFAQSKERDHWAKAAAALLFEIV